ncbi:4Fe-4S binding protein [bacterium]|nr:4Fe-4S binding protein [bacterium]
MLGRTDSGDAATVEKGRPVLTTGALAVVSTESLICDVLCRHIPGAGLADGRRGADRNAFSAAVSDVICGDARATFATAAGLAASGQRTVAMMAGDRLAQIHDQLFAAAGRRWPLVIQAANRAMPRQGIAPGTGHEGLFGVAGSGAFIAVARNAQHAVDLTLAARRLAEISLTPGIVAMDGGETAFAVQDLLLPDEAMLREFLGAPSAAIENLSDAQDMLFGGPRRAVPRWFSAERPVATGLNEPAREYALAAVGQRELFAVEVPQQARKVLEDLSSRTGRPMGFVRAHRLDKARHAVVSMGAVAEIVDGVVDRLRNEKAPVGSLAIEWLRPFPSDEIVKALARAEAVTVVERSDGGLSADGPLTREVRAALSGLPIRILSATAGLGGAPVTAQAIASLYENMKSEKPRERLHLGLAHATAGASRLPHRDVLLSAVRRRFPNLDARVAPDAVNPDPRPDGARTIVIVAREPVDTAGVLIAAATALAPIGRHVRSRSQVIEDGVWIGRVTAAPEPFGDPGDDVPADAVVIAHKALPAYFDATAGLVPGAPLVLAEDVSMESVAARAGDGARERLSGLRILRGGPALADLAAAAGALLSGGETGLKPVEIPASGFAKVAARPARDAHTLAQRTDVRYDSPVRFWNEVVQPRVLGATPESVPDPYAALGAVPARTAPLRDRMASGATIPVLDATLCTGCGDCWSACPDASIGPVALGMETLLTAGLTATGPAAEKLKRAFKQLAAHLDKKLADAGARELTRADLDDGFGWLVEKLGAGGEEKEQMGAAFAAASDRLSHLPIAVTPLFFHEPHKAAKGTGLVLGMAIDPTACQACRICATVCPTDALTIVPRTKEIAGQAADAWSVWESLPDTAGADIEKAAAKAEIGPLAALLLSRHTLLAMPGGDVAEPGSGERLAIRLTAAVVEYEVQRAMLELGGRLDGLGRGLRDAITREVTGAVPMNDLKALGDAASANHGAVTTVAELIDSLEKAGQTATVDAARLRGLARLTQAVSEERERLLHGAGDAGRARWGVVLGGETTASWMARFPHHPLHAPLTVELGDAGAMAEGLVEGLTRESLETVRLARRAELWRDAAPDRAAAETALADLAWSDLTDAERASIPPLFLVGDAESLCGTNLAGMSRLLTGDMPVKFLVLDGHGPRARGGDPAFLAIAHKSAFVASVSLAHPDHFMAQVQKALAHPGPALIHAYAPSPRRHGFETNETIALADLAVRTRVHPLLSYDPAAKGIFGARLSIDDNPAPSEMWVEDGGAPLMPAAWCAAQSRFDANGHAAALATERAGHWRMLQEIAGVQTPFTQSVREQLRAELAGAHAAELAAVRAENEKALANVRAEQADKLRRKLVELATNARRPDGEAGKTAGDD